MSLPPESIGIGVLVGHYQRIAEERMSGLPFVNPQLGVEAVGFRQFDDHLFGVLLSPWFMNMIVLPGSEEWSELPQGERVTVVLPAGDYEFTVCRDDGLPGEYLSAVLFRTVADFPDQSTARAVAENIAEMLFEAPDPGSELAHPVGAEPKPMSRRDLLSGGGAG